MSRSPKDLSIDKIMSCASRYLMCLMFCDLLHVHKCLVPSTLNETHLQLFQIVGCSKLQLNYSMGCFCVVWCD